MYDSSVTIDDMSTNNSHFITLSIKKLFLRITHKMGMLTVLLIVAASATAYFYFSPSKTTDETTLVKLGELKQYVPVTGAVQASKDASLSFQALGVVSFVGVKVGDVVPQGKVLATLDGADARASLLQAQSQLASAEATLGQLSQGFRKEEIAVKQQFVDNAKNSLEQAYVALPDTIRNVDSTTADIVKSKLSPLFFIRDGRYTLSFNSCDQNLQSVIETKRLKLDDILKEYQKKSSVISAISEQIYVDTVFEHAYTVTIATNDLVSSISDLLLASCNSQNTSLDAIKATLSSVKVTMNALFTEITTKRSALNTAKNTLSQASRDLDLTKAGTDPYKLKSQAAVVAQAEAQVAGAESGINKTVISAPFTGTISDVNITQGETVASGKVVISMLATDSFEVEAKVPEIDVVKVNRGANVDVTLDAYGKGVIFPAKVTRVNPTATIEGSVPMYKVIVTFLGKDVRIKSGMTANVNIITENKSQAVVLPSRFIEIKDEAHGSVMLRKNKKNTKVDIVLGIRGQNGLIEVINGLVPGDEIVAPAIGVRSAQKQTN